MKLQNIKKILLIGAGTMGQQISIPCAQHGYDVVLYDIKPEMLEKAKIRIKGLMDNLVQWGKMNAEEVEPVYNRISYCSDKVEAAKDVDLLIESVPEDPELKGQIFAEFNKLCPERTIFTTNTSTLLPSKLAHHTGRSDKFLAFHFHDITLTNIVDVMPHPETSPETILLVKEFAEAIGQWPIVMKKESGGYLFNRMLTSLFYAAQSLAANEVATPEDIDRAWMGVTHMLIGPFGMMDNIGIDTIWKISDFWAKKQKDPQGIKNTEFLKSYVDRGATGRKAGKGFYTYPNPDFAKPDFLSSKKQ